MKRMKLFMIAASVMLTFNVNLLRATDKVITLSPEAQQDADKIVELAKTSQIEAINQLTSLYKKYKKDIKTMTAIGQVLLDNHLYQPALEIATEAYNREATYVPAIMIMGNAYYGMKNIDEAAAKYEEAITTDPDAKEAYFQFVNVYKSIAPDVAIEKLDIIKKKFPNDPEINKELGFIYYKQGKLDEGIAAYKAYFAAIPEGGDPQAQEEYAILLFAKKDYKESLDLAQQILVKDPKSLSANRLVFYNQMELQDFDKVKETADKFFTLFNDSLYNSTDYKYSADLAATLNDPMRAVTAYEKAVKIDPKKGDLYEGLSDAYEKVGKADESVAAYKKFVQITSPEVPASAFLKEGKIYYSAATSLSDPSTDALKKHFVAAGDSIFAELAQKAPESFYGPFWQARIQTILDPNNPIEAIKNHYTEAYKRMEGKDESYNKERKECLVYFAFYFFKKDNYSEALDACNKVLTIDPANNLAKQIKGAISQLKK